MVSACWKNGKMLSGTKLCAHALFQKALEKRALAEVLKVFLTGKTAVAPYGSLIISALEKKRIFCAVCGFMLLNVMKCISEKKEIVKSDGIKKKCNQ